MAKVSVQGNWREMTQPLKLLLYKCEDLSLISRTQVKRKSGMWCMTGKTRALLGLVGQSGDCTQF